MFVIRFIKNDKVTKTSFRLFYMNFNLTDVYIKDVTSLPGTSSTTSRYFTAIHFSINGNYLLLLHVEVELTRYIYFVKHLLHVYCKSSFGI